VQVLIDQGHVDPLAIRDISWTFWEITPSSGENPEGRFAGFC
jgi:hypothetical protein